VQKRLSMFVLRAKTKLSDATERRPSGRLGLGGGWPKPRCRPGSSRRPPVRQMQHPLGTLIRWLTPSARRATNG
jgi:hypothetical protein